MGKKIYENSIAYMAIELYYGDCRRVLLEVGMRRIKRQIQELNNPSADVFKLFFNLAPPIFGVASQIASSAKLAAAFQFAITKELTSLSSVAWKTFFSNGSDTVIKVIQQYFKDLTIKYKAYQHAHAKLVWEQLAASEEIARRRLGWVDRKVLDSADRILLCHYILRELVNTYEVFTMEQLLSERKLPLKLLEWDERLREYLTVASLFKENYIMRKMGSVTSGGKPALCWSKINLVYMKRDVWESEMKRQIIKEMNKIEEFMNFELHCDVFPWDCRV